MKRVSILLLPLLLAAGCAATRSNPDPFAGLRTGQGTVVWQEEYEFIPPPEPWRLLQLAEDDYSIAFTRACGGELSGVFPCESTFAYAEEPFGYSRDFLERQEEFFRRFLWAARLEFDPPRLEKVRALGGDALLAETVGQEGVQGQKVLVRVVFARRGERVVAFYLSQWRPADGEFDRDLLEDFHRFVDSFRFRRPSFYQRLLEAS